MADKKKGFKKGLNSIIGDESKPEIEPVKEKKILTKGQAKVNPKGAGRKSKKPQSRSTTSEGLLEGKDRATFIISNKSKKLVHVVSAMEGVLIGDIVDAALGRYFSDYQQSKGVKLDPNADIQAIKNDRLNNL